MKRADIITTVGREFLTDNIENGEFSYEKALKEIGKDYLSFLASDASRRYKNLDFNDFTSKLRLWDVSCIKAQIQSSLRR